MLSFDRSTARRRLADTHFDVLVIGGGVTGAGVALDAASRGLRTALVERDDFASGTSSKSSKLVHGGLRYLQNGDIRLVYEALAERQRLRHNAPHLVEVLPFLLPIYGKDGILNKKLARAMGSAMWMYDLTGGARIGRLHRRLRKEQALAHMPTLPADRLVSAYLYYDAQADDARLTLTLARTAAVEHGAVVLNRARVSALRKDAVGRLCGATVTVDGETVDVDATVVVNATGVWSDDIRALAEGHDPDTIRPAKGIHITVPWEKVRNDIAVVIPVPKDKRSVFIVPWEGTAYVGTTDTDYDGPIDDPQCTEADIDYLLRALNFSVTTEITRDDILGTWAGLRPLVKAAESERTADLSRMHKVQRTEGGLVSISGGKLTTYRLMAADTVDAVIETLGPDVTSRIHRRSRTRSLPLRGAEGYAAALELTSGAATPEQVRHLAKRFGGEARGLLAMIEHDPTSARPLVPGLPYLRAEALWAVRYEMATTLDDVLSRRTRARLLARDSTSEVAGDVAALIAPELGWDEARTAAEVGRYRDDIEHERTAGGLPQTCLDAVLAAAS
jgi:glycerol-3-phosphate dehydrogenase